MKIVFWQNIPSLHQAAFIRALNERTGESTVLVAASDVGARAETSGWGRPDFGGAELIIEPAELEWPHLAKRFSGEAWTHVFSGLGSYPLVDVVSRILIRNRSRCGVMTETPMLFADSCRALRRRALLWRDRFRVLGRWRASDFVLGMGHMGAEWYRAAGFPANKVFPFAYFLDPVDGEMGSTKTGNGCTDFGIIFVGRLIRRKGVDVLLRALAGLAAASWRLDVIGEGPERQSLQSLSDALGLGSRVRWHGLVGNAPARKMILRSDLLVLPSHHDGWGAVVNEALLSGVPVIATESCGSAVSVAASGLGAVVRPGDSESLRDALDDHLRKGPLSVEERGRLKRWAVCLNGKSGASYFLSIMDYVYNAGSLPLPPWSEQT